LKNPDLARFFIIKPRHPCRLQKADLGGKNPQREPVAEPAQTFGGAEMFDFGRMTIFCLEKRLSKHENDYVF